MKQATKLANERIRRRLGRGAATAALAASVLTASAGPARAFTHVVKQGEQLVQISVAMYGSPRFETVLVAANGLDAHGGSLVVAGMPLQIPAPGHHVVEAGETWGEIAARTLGDAKRADVLARANAAVPWVQPSPGQEIEVPAIVPYLADGTETMSTLAARFYGNLNRSWELNQYNGRQGDKVSRGEIVLVPLLEVTLTEEGRREARGAAQRVATEAAGYAHEAQRVAEAELPPLLADVRAGRYVDAVAKGNRLLGTGPLTKPQLATIHRALLEAYVALDAPGLAARSCQVWRESTSDTRLDPRLVSPKIRAACAAK